jgi:valyl-tRNA synthetase
LLVREISAAIRRYKSERGMALNAPLSGIEVYTDWDLETLDLSGSTNSHVDVKRGVPELEKRLVKLIPQMKHIGPRFKDDSKRVIEALNRMDPEDLLRARSAGKVEVHLGNNVVEITREMFEIETLIYSAGRAVELLSVQDATILIRI